MHDPGSASQWSTLRPLLRHAATARFHPECANGPVRNMCLPSGLRPSKVQLLDFVVVSRRPVHRGQTLYRAGAPFDAIYPIRAGFFKTVVVSRSGNEQVTGVRMAGDVLGLDGISSGHYDCDAIALDHGEVCVAPFPNLLRQSLHDEALQRTFYAILGREIGREQELLLLQHIVLACMQPIDHGGRQAECRQRELVRILLEGVGKPLAVHRGLHVRASGARIEVAERHHHIAQRRGGHRSRGDQPGEHLLCGQSPHEDQPVHDVAGGGERQAAVAAAPRPRDRHPLPAAG